MKYILIISIILCFFVLVPAQPPKTVDPVKALADDFTTFIGVNDILMFVTNRGNWGHDFTDVFGQDAGTFYPYNGDTSCIVDCTYIASPYCAGGLWVGGIDSTSGDTLLAVSDYATEYAPGPMSGGTYLPDEPSFRNYRLYTDSLGDNRNYDYLNWPVGQGAPVDGEGDPQMSGNHFLWSVYNDADASRHDLPNGSTAPLGIEVRQEVFAYRNVYGGGAGRNSTIFFRFRIFNKGSNTINDCCFTFWSDPDLGGATDDMVGCDTLRNLGFVYNGDNDDVQYGDTPPALGIDLLQGVKVYTGDDADTARQWGEFYAGWKDAGMTAFSAYIGGIDPESPRETYNIMRCMPGGNPYTYSLDTLTYMYSGDPAVASGDLCPFAGDYRFLVTTGPITFRPGDSTEIIAAMVIGRGGDRLSSIAVMKYLDNNFVQFAYENGFQPSLDVPGENPTSLPVTMTLRQNYPNPFNPGTTVEFSLVRAGQVELRVYNILGELIETLFSGTLPAGDHQVYWDGLNKNGQPGASGIYLYQLRQDETVITKKMVLAK